MSKKELTKKIAIEFSEEIEKAVTALHNEMQRIADSYRARVLIPFCRRKQIQFFSGMGKFFFYSKDGTIYPLSSKEMKEHYDILFTITSGSDRLGNYVRDVKYEDYGD